MRWAAAVALLAALLSGCGEDRGPCIRSHQEYQPPIYVKSGNVMIPVGGGTVTVCDEYGPKP